MHHTLTTNEVSLDFDIEVYFYMDKRVNVFVDMKENQRAYKSARYLKNYN